MCGEAVRELGNGAKIVRTIPPREEMVTSSPAREEPVKDEPTGTHVASLEELLDSCPSLVLETQPAAEMIKAIPVMPDMHECKTTPGPRLEDLPLPKLLQFLTPTGCFRCAHLSKTFHSALVLPSGKVVVPWLTCSKECECEPMELIRKVSLENVVCAWFLAIPSALEALWDALRTGNERLPQIQRFSAKGCRVDQDALPLFKAIFASGQINLFNLELNQLSDDTVRALVDEVLIHDETLETLCIRSNKVKDEGAEALAKLVDHPCLRILNLKQNAIGVDGAHALALLLEKNSTLEVLNLRSQTPKLPKAAGIRFARALSLNSTLRRLKLRRNKMDDEVCAAFVEPLTCGAASRSLIELDLQMSSITVVGGATLALILRRNDCLEVVYAGGNRFGPEDVRRRLESDGHETSLDERMMFEIFVDV